MKTVAQKISEQFNEDGQCFTGKNGRDLSEVCKEEAIYLNAHGTDERYEFSDRSTIIIGGGTWDFGVEGCDGYCWQSVGCDCVEKEAEERQKEIELEAWEKEVEQDYKGEGHV